MQLQKNPLHSEKGERLTGKSRQPVDYNKAIT
jgi:hypothetical protein